MRTHLLQVPGNPLVSALTPCPLTLWRCDLHFNPAAPRFRIPQARDRSAHSGLSAQALEGPGGHPTLSGASGSPPSRNSRSCEEHGNDCQVCAHGRCILLYSPLGVGTAPRRACKGPGRPGRGNLRCSLLEPADRFTRHWSWRSIDILCSRLLGVHLRLRGWLLLHAERRNTRSARCLPCERQPGSGISATTERHR
jgi:hypothetical protein